ncbi:MAG: hypothetical protein ABIG95_02030 [Candidatus Woesearchaeota archaeon]
MKNKPDVIKSINELLKGSGWHVVSMGPKNIHQIKDSDPPIMSVPDWNESNEDYCAYLHPAGVLSIYMSQLSGYGTQHVAVLHQPDKTQSCTGFESIDIVLKNSGWRLVFQNPPQASLNESIPFTLPFIMDEDMYESPTKGAQGDLEYIAVMY